MELSKRPASLLLAVALLLPGLSLAETKDRSVVPGRPAMIVSPDGVTENAIVEAGTNWQLIVSSEGEESSGGRVAPRQLYVLQGEAGAYEAPLSTGMQTDIATDAETADTFFILDRETVDLIEEAEESGSLSPELLEIAEPEDIEPGTPLEGIYGELGEKRLFGRCKSKVIEESRTLSLDKPINLVNKPLGPHTTGELQASGNIQGTATGSVRVYKKRRAIFGVCVPYGVKFDYAKASGNVLVNYSANLSGTVQYSNSDLLRWQIAKPHLFSFTFYIGPVPVHVGFNLPLSVGLDMEAEATGSVTLNSQQTFQGTFNYTCSLSSCSGTSNFTRTGAPSAQPVTGSASGRIQPSLYAEAAFRAYLYDEWVAYAQVGLRAYLHGDLWGYYGNNCGDANGDGIFETVDALTFGLDWQIKVVGEASALGSSAKKFNVWSSPRNYIGFWDLIGSDAIQPMLVAGSSVPASSAQRYDAKMRPCWPYTNTVNYRLEWGDGTSTSLSGPPQSFASTNRTWTTQGAKALRLTALSDSHGRQLNQATSRTIQVVSPGSSNPGPTVPVTAGLGLWLRADAGTTLSGSRVSTWQDQSGSGNHATRPDSARWPLLVNGALNGKPVVRFEGAQSLAAPNVTLPRWTIFVVGKNSNTTENFGLILGPGSDNNQLRYENGTQVLIHGTSNNMPTYTVTVGNTRAYHSLTVRYDGSVSQIYRDGVLKGSKNQATSGSWSLGVVGGWYASCPSCQLKGDIAEILVYNAALSSADRAAVEAYLRTKYNLP